MEQEAARLFSLERQATYQLPPRDQGAMVLQDLDKLGAAIGLPQGEAVKRIAVGPLTLDSGQSFLERPKPRAAGASGDYEDDHAPGSWITARQLQAGNRPF